MTEEQNTEVADVDRDALVGRIAELERSQRQEDVDGFLALLAPTAIWVTGGGRRLVGRPEITAFTRTVLPGSFAEGSVDYRAEIITALAPDVVLTGVRQSYRDRDGQITSRGLPTYIWRRDGEDWLIVAGQNTGVPDN